MSTTLEFPTLEYRHDTGSGPLPPPEPGIYICAEPIYRRVDAWSQSAVKPALTLSLADCKDQRERPRQPTPDMLRGRAGHMYILEPAEYERTLVIAPNVERRSKEGQKAWVDAAQRMIPSQITAWELECERNGWKPYHDEAFALACTLAGRTLVQPEWVEQLRAVRAAVMGNPICRASLEAPGVSEIAAFARDPASGLNVKVRLDRLVLEAGSNIDFKLSGDIGPAREPYPGIIGQIRKFRYGFQVEWTEWLFGLLNTKVLMELAFVQWDESGKRPTDPDHVVVVNLDDSDIEAARRDRERVLARIAEAQRTNVWPGFPHHARIAARPVWDMPLE